MLVLAKVQIDRRRLGRLERPITHRSDALIADIENTLEAALDVKYLRVRLRYNHSGFPASGSLTPTKGAVACQTRLETSAIGVISQRALRFPRDFSPVSMSESSLSGIVASYWGPFRAGQIFPPQEQQRALHQGRWRPMDNAIPLRRSRRVRDDDDNDFECSVMTEPGPSTPTPAPPRSRPRARRSLLPLPPQSSEIMHKEQEQVEEEEGEDPAHKIWTQMRRRTSRNRPTNYDDDDDDEDSNKNNNNSPPTTALRVSAWDSYPSSNINIGSGGSLRLRSDVDRRRELIRDAALRNRRSIGADSLKSLVPSMMNLDIINGSGGWGDNEMMSNTLNKENVPPERRKEGRWNLGAWW